MRKALIANRGEIACRVILTCRKLGIHTVAVYSDADKSSLFVRMADEAVHIGASESADSYLNAQKIIQACLSTGSDAVHPGYGFLSENAKFAQECAKNGIIFIGPQPDSITSIGDKSSAKILLSKRAPSVPVIPGYNGDDQSIPTLVSRAKSIGFPILIKASAGGGGKGMRIVRSEESLRDEIEMAKGEAKRSFGDDKLLIEKYFEFVKHVEIQIIGDKFGNVYHCFERECSVQRRHQKVIEETPSPALTPEIRQKMCQSAITIGKLLNYEGAGTVEFILDTRDGKFYFLEVNTRLQVEHPITEAITGLDLVELQIRVASGESLKGIGLENLKINGHAIETRLYAEDPNNNFYPCTGQVLLWQIPKPNKLGYPRFDTGIETCSEISVFYDPLISKITVWGRDRPEAIRNMQYALLNTVCLGLITNKEFLLRVLNENLFLNGKYTTRLIEGMKTLTMPSTLLKVASVDHEFAQLLAKAPHRWQKIVPDNKMLELSMGMESAVVGTLWMIFQRQNKRLGVWKSLTCGWRSSSIRWKAEREEFKLVNIGQKQSITVEYISLQDSWESLKPSSQQLFLIRFVLEQKDHQEKVTDWVHVSGANVGDGKTIICSIGGYQKYYRICEQPKAMNDHCQLFVHSSTWPKQIQMQQVDLLKSEAEASEDSLSSYTSTMPCRILKLLARDGENVKQNQPLLTMESMKMETRMYAKHEGKVKFQVKEGQVVEAGKLMLEIVK